MYIWEATQTTIQILDAHSLDRSCQQKPGELIFSDLYGSMNEPSVGGAKYSKMISLNSEMYILLNIKSMRWKSFRNIKGI